MLAIVGFYYVYLTYYVPENLLFCSFYYQNPIFHNSRGRNCLLMDHPFIYRKFIGGGYPYITFTTFIFFHFLTGHSTTDHSPHHQIK